MVYKSNYFIIILKDINYLFVDGRYTLQAERQSGKKFKIITFPNKMPKNVLKNKKISLGFDPKILTKKFLNTFFGGTKIKLIPLDENLIDKFWRRKENKKIEKFYVLPNFELSHKYNYKINKVISNLKKKNADYQLITASENNAWLLNIRGKDSNYTPIPNCYMLVNKNKNVLFFSNPRKISIGFKKKFKNIKFLDIQLINKTLNKINGKNFIIDDNTCSIFYEKLISTNNKIVNYKDPVYFYKSIKTEKEINNMKKAHISDGLALTKYIFWIKKNFNKKKITEISGSEKLLSLRKNNKDYLFSSFPTISGTGPNGAIIHYKPTKETNLRLKKGDIYLVDSGGQYKFGTTDVTRTISLQNTNKRIKNIFTRVLKGHIAVTSYRLKKETSGSDLDIAARKYLKLVNLDYAHGTGHGVGYFLNVHEGPYTISKNNKIPLCKGIVVSNEPGYYEKNKFGIRIENLIYIKKKNKNNLFDTLTLVPIDKDLIDSSILNIKEKKWVNDYHKKVFQNLKGKMNKLELIDLKKACSAI